MSWRWVHSENKTGLEDWGNYGSYLQGTVASLWSLAGTLLIFVAFLAQKQQLLRQQIELEEQTGKAISFAARKHQVAKF